MSKRQNLLETERPRLPPYPKYKDSGVGWLGKIPARWEVKRLKRLFLVVNGSTPQSGVIDYWNGDIPWVTPEDLGKLKGPVIQTTRRRITEAGYRSCGTTLVPAGSLVLSTRAPIGYLAISGLELCTNQGCRSMVSRRKLNRKFFYFQLQAARSELESWGEGSTFMELAKCKLEEMCIAEPAETEQCAIAAFLDRETAKIDALIEKKERLIELLQEKRTALITQAVTKGLDPNVPMKDSGVEWLGEIPAHWRLTKMWVISQATSGATPPRETLRYWDGEIPWVSPKDMKRHFIESSEETVSDAAVAEIGLKLISPPAILIVVRGMILAHSFPIALTKVPVTINQDMKALRLRPDVDVEFFAYWLEGVASNLLAVHVEEAAHGTKAIRMDEWHKTPVGLPSPDEQRTIVKSLDQETAKIDMFITKSRAAIGRLTDFRQLIF